MLVNHLGDYVENKQNPRSAIANLHKAVSARISDGKFPTASFPERVMLVTPPVASQVTPNQGAAASQGGAAEFQLVFMNHRLPPHE